MDRKKIELREERDFGEKFNAVFTFVQSNFKPFFKVIALTVGPFALVGGFFFGLFYSKILSASGMSGMASGFAGADYVGWLVEIAISYFFLILASLWMMIAVYAYMSEYEKGNENITIEVVWNRGKGKIWPTIGFGLLSGMAITIFAVIILAFPGYGTGLMAFKVLLLFIAIFYVMIPLSMVVPNMVIDDAGVFESIGRSFILTKGKWWSTFGLMVVVGMLTNITTVIFAIPFYVALIVKLFLHLGSEGDILMAISSCILFLGSFVMMTLPMLALGFQYFNLVERKEGTGLLKKIDQLGKPANTVNEGEF